MHGKEEVWKNLIDFPNYQISNLGNVKNSTKGPIKSRMKGDYLVVTLNSKEKQTTSRIDKLVVIHFIEKPIIKEKLCIDHIDGNKLNNRVDNLQWKPYYNIPTNENEKEIWKNLIDFPNYQISNLGNVKNSTKGPIKSRMKGDYLIVSLNNIEKQTSSRIDKLVAIHFVEKPIIKEKLCIDHIDGNKLNNRVDNLQWKPYYNIPTNENEKEIWKNIINFPNYYVSNLGNVKGLKNTLKSHVSSSYLAVGLCNKETSIKKYYIHQLVAIHFLEKKVSEEKLCVDHIDGNKLNNSVYNLRWATNSENMRNKNNQHVRKILQYDLDNNLTKIWTNVKEICDSDSEFNRTNLYKALRKKKMYKGFKWEFEVPSNENIINNDEEYITIFKPIHGCYFTNYKINKNGTSIINSKTKKELSIRIYNSYKYITLYTDDKESSYKNISLHKLINLMLKDGNYEDIVDHIDGNKLNNTLENLEVVTIKENTIRSCGKGVIQLDLNGNEMKRFRTVSEAYIFVNKPISNNIQNVCNGKKKSVYGNKWKWWIS